MLIKNNHHIVPMIQCTYLTKFTPSQYVSQVVLPHSTPTFFIHKFLNLKYIYIQLYWEMHIVTSTLYFRNEGNHLLKSLDGNVRIERGSNIQMIFRLQDINEDLVCSIQSIIVLRLAQIDHSVYHT